MIGSEIEFTYGKYDDKVKRGHLAGFSSTSSYSDGDIDISPVAIVCDEDGDLHAVDVQFVKVKRSTEAK